ncbi:T9SS type A sorting domain-containing protein [Chryseobacterium gwangjuense]|uniref:T9SS type A sorting domain-containing protein n=1 Tax=Chryseobacterium gwangjuense TaxID=1069980 RepID=UPI001E2B1EA9|nr:T9SS type A sorting domain-containing protein [Chryseobacterium gwangjuense]MCE3075711.1 T9SS type A sorting domain-containing protein [Chryseobacterium gwangjuense]
MKKIYLIICVIICALFQAQVVNIPDTNFKAKLLSANLTNGIAKNITGQNIIIDSNSNGEIEATEALNVYGLEFYGSNITNLTGLENFTNLKSLKIGSMDVSSLNFNTFPNLNTLYLSSFNLVTNLTVSNLTNLTDLKITFCSNLTSLAIQNLNSLNLLTINTNSSINNLTFSNFPALTTLNCTSNSNLSNLTVTNCPILNELNLGNNVLTTLNTNSLPLLTTLILNNNELTTLNTSIFPKLVTLSAVDNNLTTVNLGLNPLIYNVYLSNNNLQYVNIKNGGQNYPNTLSLDSNPSVLQYLCCDPEDESIAKSKLNQTGLFNVVVNSYCSFTPGGIFYTIQGNTRYDSNNNACDSNDPLKPFQKFSITNGVIAGNIIANSSGNYTIPVQAGIHTITPILENPTYWSISPSVVTANFPTQTSPLTQNFCITANGNHNDLETVIIPITGAAPGFDAKYKIIYKNKGTSTQSGTLSLNYNDNISDYLSATTAPNSQSTGILNWNFTNLLPFETKEITVTIKLNTPTQTPPLNGGNILQYTAQINGATDDTPLDNTFTLNQTVVNSFDPNDKTCLEGPAITQVQVGDYVHYLIRFENTGTANAQNIVVKDEIDTSKLDLSTLVPLNASHNFVTRITNPNVVEFIFENIQLPFNNATNDGYVSFKIKTKSTLTIGNSFSNTAKIYFDYNYPIITNTYTTTVQNVLATTEVSKEKDDISIYPNPVKDLLNIQSKNEVIKAEIYDVTGRILRTTSVSNNTINVSDLTKGNYIIKLSTKDKIITQNFIKN